VRAALPSPISPFATGRRVSVFRTYTYPYMDRRNLTVLTGPLVTRVVFEGKRAVGVKFLRGGQSHRIVAGHEIVLSLGATNTLKVLMQSGIGDWSQLTRVGMDLRGGKVAMIFQEPMTALDPGYTVGQQIGETVRRHTGAAARRRAPAHSNSSNSGASHRPSAGSTPIRTSGRAALIHVKKIG
jgi:hypothetical protein